MRVVPACIFNDTRPIVVGVEVLEGVASVGMSISVPSKDGVAIGRIDGIEVNTQMVREARAGQRAVLRIEPSSNAIAFKIDADHQLFSYHDELSASTAASSIEAR
jgi:translation initiation factor IF-2